MRQVLVKRKEVYSSVGHPRRWKTLVPKPILISPCKQRFLSRRRGKAEQRNQGEGTVDMQDIFPKALMWIFMVSILELAIWFFIS